MVRMGYYDDHAHNTRESNRKQKGNRSGYLLASFVGAILGAMLIVISIPTLANFDILPYNIQPHEYSSDEENKPPSVRQTVSIDVVSDITKAVDKASDAVVGITNIQAGSFWEQTTEAGTGSGVIYKKAKNSAFIVTNFHVIEGADQLEVTLSDGTKLEAKLLGGDVWTDLAVLEIDGTKVKTVAEFGDSDALKPGETVIAIGNPLGLQFSGSVTQGIISGLERAIPIDLNQDGVVDWHAEVIQTDAAINPGNSGGALVNVAGQVVGINSMKIAQSAVEGIGLSIPINSAIPIIEDLEKYGEVKRPYMGVQLKPLSEISSYHQHETLKLPPDVTGGLMIIEVVPNSPADLAGLQRMDVIVQLDDEKIEDVIDLRKYLYIKKNIGDQMKVKFYRNGKLKETTVKLTGESM